VFAKQLEASGTFSLIIKDAYFYDKYINFVPYMTNGDIHWSCASNIDCKYLPQNGSSDTDED